VLTIQLVHPQRQDINAITDLEVSALRKAPLSPFEIVTGDLSGGKLIKFTDSPGDDVEKSSRCFETYRWLFKDLR
jgi:hypothetical protein